jgi:transcription elongation factor
MKAMVEGQEVKVGDWVGFKSDIEQSGQIVEIKKTVCFGVSLVLQNNNGFSGDYIGGETITTELARDCWIDG